MAGIGSRELLLLLIGLDEDGGSQGSISGITRLQKFLYLLEMESGVRPTGTGFEFQPYKAGPYSPKLYDDLELLENLGMIRSAATADSMDQESADIDRLSFDDLVGGLEELDGSSRAADSFEERRFALTDKGKKRVEQLVQNAGNDPVSDGIKKVKSKFSRYSLRDLLRYVYRKYPEMITESEIIDEVLGRRNR